MRAALGDLPRGGLPTVHGGDAADTSARARLLSFE